MRPSKAVCFSLLVRSLVSSTWNASADAGRLKRVSVSSFGVWLVQLRHPGSLIPATCVSVSSFGVWLVQPITISNPRRAFTSKNANRRPPRASVTFIFLAVHPPFAICPLAFAKTDFCAKTCRVFARRHRLLCIKRRCRASDTHTPHTARETAWPLASAHAPHCPIDHAARQAFRRATPRRSAPPSLACAGCNR